MSDAIKPLIAAAVDRPLTRAEAELARALEQEKIAVKLFEIDAKRCDYLATELAHTVVINADGTSQEILIEEQVEGVDELGALHRVAADAQAGRVTEGRAGADGSTWKTRPASPVSRTTSVSSG
mgnify:CR=1 FL=1